MTTYTLSIIVEGQDKASGPLGGIAGAIGRIGQIAGGVLVAGAFQALGQGMLNFASQAINATMQMQAFDMGLQTLVSRELRAADSTLSLEQAFAQAGPMAENLSAAIRKIAIASPYELGQVQDTFRLAMAFGFASDEATSFTKGLLNMAAGVGASNDMLGRMAYNLAQIRLQGKVTAVDVRQLAMAGFDLNAALKDIGAQFGLTIEDHEDFNRAIAQGKIKWEDFASSFEKYAEKEFGGAADRMSRSLTGLKSTFTEFFLLTAPAVLGPASEEITAFLSGILDRLIAFTDSGALTAWGEALGEAAGRAVDRLNYLMLLFFRVRIGAMDAAQAFRLFTGIDGAGLAQFAPIADALSNALRDLGPIARLAIKDLGEAFGNLATFVIDNGPAILATLTGVFASLIDFGTQVSSDVLPFLVAQFGKISQWFVANGPLITSALQVMADGFQALLGILAGAGAWIGPFFDGLVTHLLTFSTMTMQILTGDLPGAFESLQLLMTNALTVITGLIFNFLNWIASFFGTSLAQIAAVWTGNWNLLVSILTTVAGRIISTVLQFMSNTQNMILAGLNLVKSVWTANWNALGELTASIGKKIIQTVGTMVSGMASTISGGAKAMYNAGVSMLQGLADGISKKANEILAKVKQLAADIASAFAGVLQIKSPSRIFIGFGENIMAGLANGIRASAGLAEQAIGSSAQAVMSPFSASGSSTSTSTTNNVYLSVRADGNPNEVAEAIMRQLKAQGLGAA